MNALTKVPTLINMLSVRLDDVTFARVLAAARLEHRQLSCYVRLLLERCEATGQRYS